MAMSRPRDRGADTLRRHRVRPHHVSGRLASCCGTAARGRWHGSTELRAQGRRPDAAERRPGLLTARVPLTLLLAICAISTGAPFARWAAPAPPIVIAALRVALASVLLL